MAFAGANRSVTPRGFVTYDELGDDEGHRVTVRESSAFARSAGGRWEDGPWVHVFIEGIEGGATPSHLLLSVEQAARLRDALDAFVRERGGFPDAAPDGEQGEQGEQGKGQDGG